MQDCFFGYASDGLFFVEDGDLAVAVLFHELDDVGEGFGFLDAYDFCGVNFLFLDFGFGFEASEDVEYGFDFGVGAVDFA